MEVLFLMLVELLGVIATVICTFTQISLMFLSFKDKDAALKVISLPSCLLVIISTSLWLGYGIVVSSFSVSLQALVNMASTLAIIFVLHSKKYFAGAITVIATVACADLIGGEQFVNNITLVASVVYALMFVPFTVKSTRSVAAAMEVPNSTMLSLLCGNVLWIAYGVILHQVPVIISSLLPALCGVVIGVLKIHGTRKKKKVA